MAVTHDPLAQLHRIRRGTWAALVLGIAASLAANVLAANPSIIGRLIAAWSPISLLVTVELLSRVPTTSSFRSRLRVTAAAAIALIAAWVSYWHMVLVALTDGERPVAAHLLPFSVDGLVVVASVSLVELRARPSTRPSHPTRADNGPKPATRVPPLPAGAGRSATAAADRGAASPAVGPAPPRAAGNGTAVAVRRIASEHPDWTQAQIADAAGCSERSVRRHLTVTALA